MKKGLGRGLGALIPDLPEEENLSKGDILEESIEKITPNPEQPRRYFSEAALEELSQSIKEFGIIAPIVVNKKPNGTFEIIAGERRYRASKMAGLTHVPIIVKSYSDLEALQIALIENIQRQDLNPIEEALSYKKLIDYFFFNKETIAGKVGKSRNTIANRLNLLNLSEDIQNLIAEGTITANHALLLLNKENQVELANKIVEEGLSIKETEALFKDEEFSEKQEKPLKKPRQIYYENFEKDLENFFGTKVEIKGQKKGKIEIEYKSEEELARLIQSLKSPIGGE
ncbi:MAG: ParB/RepB/Spo0J family partition protein [Defluviitaleaceae bacterium]|nr:ParB/RepB/Spo0J family partition protein [Defluviitaleaceae bacterium]